MAKVETGLVTVAPHKGPPKRSEYICYEVGKSDFFVAVNTGISLQCTLTDEEMGDSSLVRKWVHGCNHAELQLKARTPAVKVEARGLSQQLLKRHTAKAC